MERTRLDLTSLRVQSFVTLLDEDEAQADHGSGRQCISEVSACGICTDTYAA